MIRPLRSRHRVMIVALAVLVPTLFALGLRARRPTPPTDLSAVLAKPSFEDGAVLTIQSKQLPGEFGLTIRQLHAETDGSPQRLWVEVTVDPHLPEILAYWSARGAVAGSALDGDVRLLGPLDPRTPSLYDLPAAFDAARPGWLVLYSLAGAEVVDAIELQSTGASR